VSRCARCGLPEPPFVMPLPFGSVNARHPVEVCPQCFGDAVRLIYAFLGRMVPTDIDTEYGMPRYTLAGPL
jgi:hypothetical protein